MATTIPGLKTRDRIGEDSQWKPLLALLTLIPRHRHGDAAAPSLWLLSTQVIWSLLKRSQPVNWTNRIWKYQIKPSLKISGIIHVRRWQCFQRKLFLQLEKQLSHPENHVLFHCPATLPVLGNFHTAAETAAILYLTFLGWIFFWTKHLLQSICYCPFWETLS